MFLLRDEGYYFIQSISNAKIETTSDLSKAILFDNVQKAKALKTYIELDFEYKEIDILEIVLNDVDMEGT